MSLPKTTLTLLAIVCVYTKPVQCASQVSLPATNGQMKVLAAQVCRELFHFKDKPKQKSCEERILHPNKELSNSIPTTVTLQIVCQSQQKVMFRANSVKGMMLVALLPEDGRVLVNFKILTETKTAESIPIVTQGNYTLWTASLDPDGTPSVWHKGPDVPWIGDAHMDYEIRVGEPKFEYRITNDVEATFGITIDGAPNACADVTITNTCNKIGDGKVFYKRIKLINQTIAIKNVSTNDKCTLSVHRGKQRIKHKYQTPWCEELPGCMPPPEKPNNIHLEANASASGYGWDVLVSWDKPTRFPDKYNVTLLADLVKRTVILNGNTSQVLFSDVKAEGLYNVSIEAIDSNGSVWNTARAFFTAGGDEGGGGGTRSLALCGAALLLALLALLLCCRARQQYHYEEYYKEHYLPAPEIAHRKGFGVGSSPPVAEDSWEIKSERLLMHEVLGEGAFGVVRRGTLAPEAKDVAVKMLKEFPTLEEHRAFRKEMELMKTVGAHPHVVSLVGCCHGRSPRIVVEYCSRGDLLSFLRCSWDVLVSKHNVKYYNNNRDENTNYRNDLFTNKLQTHQTLTNFVVNKMYDLQSVCDSDLTSSDLLSFCRQIAMGMEFLASNRLVHRDLAARNILVTADKTLKIADFGLSRDVYQDNQYKQKGNSKMPIKWMALESLTHRIYTTATDVWSFGVVMWEIATLGAAPYPDVPVARLSRILRAGYRMPRPLYCPQQLYELMLECWRARPKERPTFADLHVKLDELLNTACSEQYLSLEVDEETAAIPKPQGYFKMLLKGNRLWSWREQYEPPWKVQPSNHYIKTPSYKTIAV